MRPTVFRKSKVSATEEEDLKPERMPLALFGGLAPGGSCMQVISPARALADNQRASSKSCSFPVMALFSVGYDAKLKTTWWPGQAGSHTEGAAHDGNLIALGCKVIRFYSTWQQNLKLNLNAMASNLIAVASNPEAMASTLLAMALDVRTCFKSPG